jgi:hypothetical protein
MSVMIGVPRLGDAPWPMVESLLGLQAPNGFVFVQRGPAPVDIARNQIAATFLASRCSHLLMVDSDAVLHRDTLDRLLSWNMPVVAALAFMRKGPCLPTVYLGRRPEDPEAFQVRLAETHGYIERYGMATSQPTVIHPRPDDALFQVDRTGCHCVLIKREVFMAISAPWFVRDETMNAKEDFYFYGQVQAAGFPVYVDMSCMASHIYGDRLLGALDHIVWDRVSQYKESN